MATFIVDVNDVKVKTTVTNTISFVDSFVTELVLSCNYRTPTRPIIGFDVEFNNCKPATVQLCSGSRCIIVQLNRMSAVPQSLLNLFSAALFCFVGLDVHEKLSALRREYGITCTNMVDLTPLVVLAEFSGCLKMEPKPLNIVMANWGAQNLSMDQIQSVVSDAHTFFQLGKLFFC